jgi:hypothetical protein
MVFRDAWIFACIMVVALVSECRRSCGGWACLDVRDHLSEIPLAFCLVLQSYRL